MSGAIHIDTDDEGGAFQMVRHLLDLGHRRILHVSGTWNAGQQLVQLSDDGGRNWREIEDGTSGVTVRGWIDDIEIDPFNRDRVMHIHGGGILETRNASAASPVWAEAVNGLEETCTLGLATPPAGAAYTFLNSSGDVGTWVHTSLTTKPTSNPQKVWGNGNSADMAWSDPSYIAANGIINNANGTHVGVGYWSGDSGKTWSSFAKLPADAVTSGGAESNLLVTARNKVVWAPGDSVPSYMAFTGHLWRAFSHQRNWGAPPGSSMRRCWCPRPRSLPPLAPFCV